MPRDTTQPQTAKDWWATYKAEWNRKAAEYAANPDEEYEAEQDRIERRHNNSLQAGSEK